MGKCSSKLERTESESSFHVRGSKPSTTRPASVKDATTSTQSSKDKLDGEDVAVVEQEGAHRSGESSSEASGLLRKRNLKATGLSGLKSSTASASSQPHDEGAETFHDASEELGPPSVPATPATKSPTSFRFESPVFSPSKDSSSGTSPPASGSERDLGSSQSRSRLRLSSSSLVPRSRSAADSPIATLRPSFSQKVGKDAFSVESSTVSPSSAAVVIPDTPVAAGQAELSQVDSRKHLEAKEHETMKAFVELGEIWELVTRSPLSAIQAALKKDESESFTTQQESKVLDTEAEKKMELDDSASRIPPIDAVSREIVTLKPVLADDNNEGTLGQEISDESETTSGSLSPATLLRREGYTSREEPLATELKITKPVSISSRSDSTGSGDFEIIRGPEDERTTPRSPSPQISETSQPEIVDSAGEIQAAVDEELSPQFTPTTTKEVSEKLAQQPEKGTWKEISSAKDLANRLDSQGPRTEEQGLKRQKSVKQIVHEIEARTLHEQPKTEVLQTERPPVTQQADTVQITEPQGSISAPPEDTDAAIPDPSVTHHTSLFKLITPTEPTTGIYLSSQHHEQKGKTRDIVLPLQDQSQPEDQATEKQQTTVLREDLGEVHRDPNATQKDVAPEIETFVQQIAPKQPVLEAPAALKAAIREIQPCLEIDPRAPDEQAAEEEPNPEPLPKEVYDQPTTTKQEHVQGKDDKVVDALPEVAPVEPLDRVGDVEKEPQLVPGEPVEAPVVEEKVAAEQPMVDAQVALELATREIELSSEVTPLAEEEPAVEQQPSPEALPKEVKDELPTAAKEKKVAAPLEATAPEQLAKQEKVVEAPAKVAPNKPLAVTAEVEKEPDVVPEEPEKTPVVEEEVAPQEPVLEAPPGPKVTTREIELSLEVTPPAAQNSTVDQEPSPQVLPEEVEDEPTATKEEEQVAALPEAAPPKEPTEDEKPVEALADIAPVADPLAVAPEVENKTKVLPKEPLEVPVVEEEVAPDEPVLEAPMASEVATREIELPLELTPPAAQEPTVDQEPSPRVLPQEVQDDPTATKEIEQVVALPEATPPAVKTLPDVALAMEPLAVPEVLPKELVEAPVVEEEVAAKETVPQPGPDVVPKEIELPLKVNPQQTEELAVREEPSPEVLPKQVEDEPRATKDEQVVAMLEAAPTGKPQPKEEEVVQTLADVAPWETLEAVGEVEKEPELVPSELVETPVVEAPAAPEIATREIELPFEVTPPAEEEPTMEQQPNPEALPKEVDDELPMAAKEEQVAAPLEATTPEQLAKEEKVVEAPAEVSPQKPLVVTAEVGKEPNHQVLPKEVQDEPTTTKEEEQVATLLEATTPEEPAKDEKAVEATKEEEQVVALLEATTPKGPAKDERAVEALADVALAAEPLEVAPKLEKMIEVLPMEPQEAPMLEGEVACKDTNPQAAPNLATRQTELPLKVTPQEMADLSVGEEPSPEVVPKEEQVATLPQEPQAKEEVVEDMADVAPTEPFEEVEEVEKEPELVPNEPVEAPMVDEEFAPEEPVVEAPTAPEVATKKIELPLEFPPPAEEDPAVEQQPSPEALSKEVDNELPTAANKEQVLAPLEATAPEQLAKDEKVVEAAAEVSPHKYVMVTAEVEKDPSPQDLPKKVQDEPTATEEEEQVAALPETATPEQPPNDKKAVEALADVAPAAKPLEVAGELEKMIEVLPDEPEEAPMLEEEVAPKDTDPPATSDLGMTETEIPWKVTPKEMVDLSVQEDPIPEVLPKEVEHKPRVTKEEQVAALPEAPATEELQAKKEEVVEALVDVPPPEPLEQVREVEKKPEPIPGEPVELPVVEQEVAPKEPVLEAPAAPEVITRETEHQLEVTPLAAHKPTVAQEPSPHVLSKGVQDGLTSTKEEEQVEALPEATALEEPAKDEKVVDALPPVALAVEPPPVAPEVEKKTEVLPEEPVEARLVQEEVVAKEMAPQLAPDVMTRAIQLPLKVTPQKMEELAGGDEPSPEVLPKKSEDEPRATKEEQVVAMPEVAAAEEPRAKDEEVVEALADVAPTELLDAVGEVEKQPKLVPGEPVEAPVVDQEVALEEPVVDSPAALEGASREIELQLEVTPPAEDYPAVENHPSPEALPKEIEGELQKAAQKELVAAPLEATALEQLAKEEKVVEAPAEVATDKPLGVTAEVEKEPSPQVLPKEVQDEPTATKEKEQVASLPEVAKPEELVKDNKVVEAAIPKVNAMEEPQAKEEEVVEAQLDVAPMDLLDTMREVEKEPELVLEEPMEAPMVEEQVLAKEPVVDAPAAPEVATRELKLPFNVTPQAEDEQKLEQEPSPQTLPKEVDNELPTAAKEEQVAAPLEAIAPKQLANQQKLVEAPAEVSPCRPLQVPGEVEKDPSPQILTKEVEDEPTTTKAKEQVAALLEAATPKQPAKDKKVVESLAEAALAAEPLAVAPEIEKKTQVLPKELVEALVVEEEVAANEKVPLPAPDIVTRKIELPLKVTPQETKKLAVGEEPSPKVLPKEVEDKPRATKEEQVTTPLEAASMEEPKAKEKEVMEALVDVPPAEPLEEVQEVEKEPDLVRGDPMEAPVANEEGALEQPVVEAPAAPQVATREIELPLKVTPPAKEHPAVEQQPSPEALPKEVEDDLATAAKEEQVATPLEAISPKQLAQEEKVIDAPAEVGPDKPLEVTAEVEKEPKVVPKELEKAHAVEEEVAPEEPVLEVPTALEVASREMYLPLEVTPPAEEEPAVNEQPSPEAIPTEIEDELPIAAEQEQLAATLEATTLEQLAKKEKVVEATAEVSPNKPLQNTAEVEKKPNPQVLPKEVQEEPTATKEEEQVASLPEPATPEEPTKDEKEVEALADGAPAAEPLAVAPELEKMTEVLPKELEEPPVLKEEVAPKDTDPQATPDLATKESELPLKLTPQETEDLAVEEQPSPEVLPKEVEDEPRPTKEERLATLPEAPATEEPQAKEEEVVETLANVPPAEPLEEVQELEKEPKLVPREPMETPVVEQEIALEEPVLEAPPAPEVTTRETELPLEVTPPAEHEPTLDQEPSPHVYSEEVQDEPTATKDEEEVQALPQPAAPEELAKDDKLVEALANVAFGVEPLPVGPEVEKKTKVLLEEPVEAPVVEEAVATKETVPQPAPDVVTREIELPLKVTPQEMKEVVVGEEPSPEVLPEEVEDKPRATKQEQVAALPETTSMEEPQAKEEEVMEALVDVPPAEPLEEVQKVEKEPELVLGEPMETPVVGEEVAPQEPVVKAPLAPEVATRETEMPLEVTSPAEEDPAVEQQASPEALPREVEDELRMAAKEQQLATPLEEISPKQLAKDDRVVETPAEVALDKPLEVTAEVEKEPQLVPRDPKKAHVVEDEVAPEEPVVEAPAAPEVATREIELGLKVSPPAEEDPPVVQQPSPQALPKEIEDELQTAVEEKQVATPLEATALEQLAKEEKVVEAWAEIATDKPLEVTAKIENEPSPQVLPKQVQDEPTATKQEEQVASLLEVATPDEPRKDNKAVEVAIPKAATMEEPQAKGEEVVEALLDVAPTKPLDAEREVEKEPKLVPGEPVEAPVVEEQVIGKDQVVEPPAAPELATREIELAFEVNPQAEDEPIVEQQPSPEALPKEVDDEFPKAEKEEQVVAPLEATTPKQLPKEKNLVEAPAEVSPHKPLELPVEAEKEPNRQILPKQVQDEPTTTNEEEQVAALPEAATPEQPAKDEKVVEGLADVALAAEPLVVALEAENKTEVLPKEPVEAPMVQEEVATNETVPQPTPDVVTREIELPLKVTPQEKKELAVGEEPSLEVLPKEVEDKPRATKEQQVAALLEVAKMEEQEVEEEVMETPADVPPEEPLEEVQEVEKESELLPGEPMEAPVVDEEVALEELVVEAPAAPQLATREIELPLEVTPPAKEDPAVEEQPSPEALAKKIEDDLPTAAKKEQLAAPLEATAPEQLRKKEKVVKVAAEVSPHKPLEVTAEVEKEPSPQVLPKEVQEEPPATKDEEQVAALLEVPTPEEKEKAVEACLDVTPAAEPLAVGLELEKMTDMLPEEPEEAPVLKEEVAPKDMDPQAAPDLATRETELSLKLTPQMEDLAVEEEPSPEVQPKEVEDEPKATKEEQVAALPKAPRTKEPQAKKEEVVEALTDVPPLEPLEEVREVEKEPKLVLGEPVEAPVVEEEVAPKELLLEAPAAPEVATRETEIPLDVTPPPAHEPIVHQEPSPHVLSKEEVQALPEATAPEKLAKDKKVVEALADVAFAVEPLAIAPEVEKKTEVLREEPVEAPAVEDEVAANEIVPHRAPDVGTREIELPLKVTPQETEELAMGEECSPEVLHKEVENEPGATKEEQVATLPEATAIEELQAKEEEVMEALAVVTPAETLDIVGEEEKEHAFVQQEPMEALVVEEVVAKQPVVEALGTPEVATREIQLPLEVIPQAEEDLAVEQQPSPEAFPKKVDDELPTAAKTEQVATTLEAIAPNQLAKEEKVVEAPIEVAPDSSLEVTTQVAKEPKVVPEEPEKAPVVEENVTPKEPVVGAPTEPEVATREIELPFEVTPPAEEEQALEQQPGPKTLPKEIVDELPTAPEEEQVPAPIGKTTPKQLGKEEKVVEGPAEVALDKPLEVTTGVEKEPNPQVLPKEVQDEPTTTKEEKQVASLPKPAPREELAKDDKAVMATKPEAATMEEPQAKEEEVVEALGDVGTAKPLDALIELEKEPELVLREPVEVLVVEKQVFAEEPLVEEEVTPKEPVVEAPRAPEVATREIVLPLEVTPPVEEEPTEEQQPSPGALPKEVDDELPMAAKEEQVVAPLEAIAPEQLAKEEKLVDAPTEVSPHKPLEVTSEVKKEPSPQDLPKEVQDEQVVAPPEATAPEEPANDEKVMEALGDVAPAAEPLSIAPKVEKKTTVLLEEPMEAPVIEEKVGPKETVPQPAPDVVTRKIEVPFKVTPQKMEELAVGEERISEVLPKEVEDEPREAKKEQVAAPPEAAATEQQQAKEEEVVEALADFSLLERLDTVGEVEKEPKLLPGQLLEAPMMEDEVVAKDPMVEPLATPEVATKEIELPLEVTPPAEEDAAVEQQPSPESLPKEVKDELPTAAEEEQVAARLEVPAPKQLTKEEKLVEAPAEVAHNNPLELTTEVEKDPSPQVLPKEVQHEPTTTKEEEQVASLPKAIAPKEPAKDKAVEALADIAPVVEPLEVQLELQNSSEGIPEETEEAPVVEEEVAPKDTDPQAAPHLATKEIEVALKVTPQEMEDLAVEEEPSPEVLPKEVEDEQKATKEEQVAPLPEATATEALQPEEEEVVEALADVPPVEPLKEVREVEKVPDFVPRESMETPVVEDEVAPEEPVDEAPAAPEVATRKTELPLQVTLAAAYEPTEDQEPRLQVLPKEVQDELTTTNEEEQVKGLLKVDAPEELAKDEKAVEDLVDVALAMEPLPIAPMVEKKTKVLREEPVKAPMVEGEVAAKEIVPQRAPNVGTREIEFPLKVTPQEIDELAVGEEHSHEVLHKEVEDDPGATKEDQVAALLEATAMEALQAKEEEMVEALVDVPPAEALEEVGEVEKELELVSGEPVEAPVMEEEVVLEELVVEAPGAPEIATSKTEPSPEALCKEIEDELPMAGEEEQVAAPLEAISPEQLTKEENLVEAPAEVAHNKLLEVTTEVEKDPSPQVVPKDVQDEPIATNEEEEVASLPEAPTSKEPAKDERAMAALPDVALAAKPLEVEPELEETTKVLPKALEEAPMLEEEVALEDTDPQAAADLGTREIKVPLEVTPQEMEDLAVEQEPSPEVLPKEVEDEPRATKEEQVARVLEATATKVLQVKEEEVVEALADVPLAEPFEEVREVGKQPKLVRGEPMEAPVVEEKVGPAEPVVEVAAASEVATRKIELPLEVTPPAAHEPTVHQEPSLQLLPKEVQGEPTTTKEEEQVASLLEAAAPKEPTKDEKAVEVLADVAPVAKPIEVEPELEKTTEVLPEEPEEAPEEQEKDEKAVEALADIALAVEPLAFTPEVEKKTKVLPKEPVEAPVIEEEVAAKETVPQGAPDVATREIEVPLKVTPQEMEELAAGKEPSPGLLPKEVEDEPRATKEEQVVAMLEATTMEQPQAREEEVVEALGDVAPPKPLDAVGEVENELELVPGEPVEAPVVEDEVVAEDPLVEVPGAPDVATMAIQPPLEVTRPAEEDPAVKKRPSLEALPKEIEDELPTAVEEQQVATLPKATAMEVLQVKEEEVLEALADVPLVEPLEEVREVEKEPKLVLEEPVKAPVVEEKVGPAEPVVEAPAAREVATRKTELAVEVTPPAAHKPTVHQEPRLQLLYKEVQGEPTTTKEEEQVASLPEAATPKEPTKGEKVVEVLVDVTQVAEPVEVEPELEKTTKVLLEEPEEAPQEKAKDEKAVEALAEVAPTAEPLELEPELEKMTEVLPKEPEEAPEEQEKDEKAVEALADVSLAMEPLAVTPEEPVEAPVVEEEVAAKETVPQGAPDVVTREIEVPLKVTPQETKELAVGEETSPELLPKEVEDEPRATKEEQVAAMPKATTMEEPLAKEEEVVEARGDVAPLELLDTGGEVENEPEPVPKEPVEAPVVEDEVVAEDPVVEVPAAPEVATMEIQLPLEFTPPAERDPAVKQQPSPEALPKEIEDELPTAPEEQVATPLEATAPEQLAKEENLVEAPAEVAHNKPLEVTAEVVKDPSPQVLPKEVQDEPIATNEEEEVASLPEAATPEKPAKDEKAVEALPDVALAAEPLEVEPELEEAPLLEEEVAPGDTDPQVAADLATREIDIPSEVIPQEMEDLAVDEEPSPEVLPKEVEDEPRATKEEQVATLLEATATKVLQVKEEEVVEALADVPLAEPLEEVREVEKEPKLVPGEPMEAPVVEEEVGSADLVVEAPTASEVAMRETELPLEVTPPAAHKPTVHEEPSLQLLLREVQGEPTTTKEEEQVASLPKAAPPKEPEKDEKAVEVLVEVAPAVKPIEVLLEEPEEALGDVAPVEPLNTVREVENKPELVPREPVEVPMVEEEVVAEEPVVEAPAAPEVATRGIELPLEVTPPAQEDPEVVDELPTAAKEEQVAAPLEALAPEQVTKEEKVVEAWAEVSLDKPFEVTAEIEKEPEVIPKELVVEAPKVPEVVTREIALLLEVTPPAAQEPTVDQEPSPQILPKEVQDEPTATKEEEQVGALSEATAPEEPAKDMKAVVALADVVLAAKPLAVAPEVEKKTEVLPEDPMEAPVVEEDVVAKQTVPQAAPVVATRKIELPLKVTPLEREELAVEEEASPEIFPKEVEDEPRATKQELLVALPRAPAMKEPQAKEEEVVEALADYALAKPLEVVGEVENEPNLVQGEPVEAPVVEAPRAPEVATKEIELPLEITPPEEEEPAVEQQPSCEALLKEVEDELPTAAKDEQVAAPLEVGAPEQPAKEEKVVEALAEVSPMKELEVTAKVEKEPEVVAVEPMEAPVMEEEVALEEPVVVTPVAPEVATEGIELPLEVTPPAAQVPKVDKDPSPQVVHKEVEDEPTATKEEKQVAAAPEELVKEEHAMESVAVVGCVESLDVAPEVKKEVVLEELIIGVAPKVATREIEVPLEVTQPGVEEPAVEEEHGLIEATTTKEPAKEEPAVEGVVEVAPRESLEVASEVEKELEVVTKELVEVALLEEKVVVEEPRVEAVADEGSRVHNGAEGGDTSPRDVVTDEWAIEKVEMEQLLKGLGFSENIDICMCVSCLYRRFLIREHLGKVLNINGSKEDGNVEGLVFEGSIVPEVETKMEVDAPGEKCWGKPCPEIGMVGKVQEGRFCAGLTDEEGSVIKIVQGMEGSFKSQETHSSDGSDLILGESQQAPVEEPSRLDAGLPSIVPNINLTSVY